MPIKSRILICVFFACTALGGLAGSSLRDEHDDGSPQARAAHLMVYGTLEGFEAWDLGESISADSGVLQYFDLFHADLQRNASAKDDVYQRAYFDAFGKVASEDAVSNVQPLNYCRQLAGFVQQLSIDPLLFTSVVQRAYRAVIYRDAYAEEIDYWKSRGTWSFIALVAGIEDWARRNQPGLMVTNGSPTASANCEFITSVVLSPGIDIEKLVEIVFPQQDETSGYRILTPGATALMSSGDQFFVMAGCSTFRSEFAGEVR